MNATLEAVRPSVKQFIEDHDPPYSQEKRDKVLKALGKSKSTAQLKVPVDKEEKALKALGKGSPTPPDPPEEAPPAPKPSGGSLVTTRKRQSKGAFEPTRLLRDKKITLTPADRMTLSQLQQVVDTVKKFQDRRREARTVGRRGDVEIQDLLRPERWIRMSLPEYQKRSAEKTLPPLHRDTIAELAQPLSRLSLVNYTCKVCLQPLEKPYYLGMLEHVLAGNADLPHRPNAERAIKYPVQHKACPGILGVLAQIEMDLEFMEEGDAKEAARIRRLMERLQDEGGKMLSEFMQSEHKPLSAKEAKARIMSIIEHVKRAREEFSRS